MMDTLEQFHIFDAPLLVGISRKRMIWGLLDTTAEDSLTGTIALNTVALSKGAHILRVHDVKACAECIKICAALNH